VELRNLLCFSEDQRDISGERPEYFCHAREDFETNIFNGE
jgi:hypothetical protein